MSVYPPPTQRQTIFNPYNYSSLDDALTRRQANQTYLIKTGADTDYGTITMKQPIYLADGSLASPSASFLSEISTGFYKTGAGELRVAVSGSNVLRITSNVVNVNDYIRVANGSVVTPSLGFQNSGDTGIYLSSPGVMGITTGTDLCCSFTGRFMYLYGSSYTLSGYTPSGFGCYEEYTFTTTFYYGSGTQSGSFSNYVTRIGNVVTLVMSTWGSSFTNTTGFSSVINSVSFLPARFRPIGTGSYNPYQVVMIEVGGARAYGNFSVSHTGIVTIWNALRTQFVNGAVVRLSDTITLSWVAAN